MTQVVTDYVDNKVIQAQEVSNVVVSDKQASVIVTGMMPPAQVSSITNSVDIDTAGLVDGALLVYNSEVSKWVCTQKLEKQIFEAGQY